MSFYKIASFIFFGILTISCTEKEAGDGKETIKHEIYKGPSLESKDLNVVYTDSGLVSMTMITKEQIILHNEDQEYPKGLYVTFYDKNQEVSSTIKANYGYYYDQKDQWKLKGDVVVFNPLKGQKMETQRMFWTPKTQDILVETTDSVTITEPEQVLFGMGLKAKDDFSQYKITNPKGFRWVED